MADILVHLLLRMGREISRYITMAYLDSKCVFPFLDSEALSSPDEYAQPSPLGKMTPLLANWSFIMKNLK